MPALRIVVIAEGEADQRMVCGLVDRKLVHHAPDWFDPVPSKAVPDPLDALRTWHGLEPGTTWTRFRHLSRFRLAAYGGIAPGVRALGLARSEPGEGNYDRQAFRGALAAFLLGNLGDVLLVSRDLDGQHPAERRASLEDVAGEAGERGVAVLLAVQDPMREAWLLNGFAPTNAAEEEKLKTMRDKLGFDPCTQSGQLTAADETAQKSAKRVLRFLTDREPIREEACWESTDWGTLRVRGAGTGLAQFLEAVKTRLVPMVMGQPSR